MGLGQMANWSYVYVGDRPRSVLKLTEAVEAKCKQFIGFSGKSPNGDPADQFIIVNENTSVTLSDYSDVPIGTIILTPKVASVAFYQRIAQATPGASVDADWNKVAKTTV